MQTRKTTSALIALLLLATLIYPAFAKKPRLPEKPPIPALNSSPGGQTAPDAPDQMPIPEPRPDIPDEDQSPTSADGPAAASPKTPAMAPLPEKSPADHNSAAGKPKDLQPDPRSAEAPAAEMPPAEIACRQRLQNLRVAFQDMPPETDVSGCSLPYPVNVKTLGDGVAIEPEALMTCAMAEAAARFASDVISPAAKRDFGAGLKSVSQASAYVCRPRNGTSKLSEHAFGNALDIAAFKLSNGKKVDVALRPDEDAARFLGTLRKAACGPFKAVLGPGSNADHATHFHLDLAPRRNGGTVCE